MTQPDLHGTEAATSLAVKCELAGEALSSLGQLRFPAVGWSMVPSVFPGDTLVVENVDIDQVRLGDVVLVGLTAHRVVGFEGADQNRRCITRGDALSVDDQATRTDRLLGRVVSLIRGGRMLPIAAELNAIDKLVAGIARRSTPAARAFVYLNRMRLAMRGPASLHAEEKPK